MKKREDKTNYILLTVFFVLGYFFGFILIGVFAYPLIKFNEDYLTYSMKNGMVCGFVVGIFLLILLSL